jgi:hypothetical protein
MAAKPKVMLVYYGYLNSFNSAVNGWVNEAVALDMAKYDVLVFGDGTEVPTHPDYANTQIIIARLKVLKPDILIYGYVSANQALNTFQTKVDQWDTLAVHGIFLDESGYDYGVSRDALNACILHVRSKSNAKLCFANAWNMDHVIGTVNDVSFPNTTFNPSLHPSLLDSRDYYMLESFVVNTDAYGSNNNYATQSDFLVRGNKAISLSGQSGVKLAALNIINNANASGQNLFNFCYNAAVMFGIDLSGSSDSSYASGSAAVKFWNRPNKKHIGKTSVISVTQKLSDTDVCLRYGDHARVLLDFSTGAQTSSIEIW